jgi:hypothetical protein
LSGTTVRLVGGDPRVPMSHTVEVRKKIVRGSGFHVVRGIVLTSPER